MGGALGIGSVYFEWKVDLSGPQTLELLSFHSNLSDVPIFARSNTPYSARLGSPG